MKKLILLFLITFLTSLSIYSQEYHYSEGNFTKQIIPLIFDNGCPVIEIKIDGKLFHLLIDTGAEDAIVKLTHNALKKILVTTQTGEDRTFDYKGNSYQNMKFSISSLKIGELEFRNVNASEELRTTIEEDGIIGNQLQKKFNVLFDYKAERMVLYPLNSYPEEIKNESWTKINIEHNNIGLTLNCRTELAERDLKFCLDTGVGSIENGKTYGILKTTALDKEREKNETINIEKLQIDGINLAPFDFKFLDFNIPPIDGFLGNNFFTKYKVLIDFNHNLIYLKKY
jgi:hypothetical protein